MADKDRIDDYWGMPAEKAKEKIQELKEDKKFVDKFCKGSEEAKVRMHRLHEVAYAKGKRLLYKP